jgi:hypothetical protein
VGFLGRLFGTEAPLPDRPAGRTPAAGRGQPAGSLTDAQALERYRYMLQTAPPETIEQAHQEAFAKLSPEQRRQLLSGLAEAAPPAEAAAILQTPVDDTRALARAATRAEIRQPGVMERSMAGGGMGLGASLLSSFAMGFVGSMVANSFFAAMGGFGDEPAAAHGDDAAAGDEQAAADDTQLADHEGDAGYEDDGGFGDGGDFEV